MYGLVHVGVVKVIRLKLSSKRYQAFRIPAFGLPRVKVGARGCISVNVSNPFLLEWSCFLPGLPRVYMVKLTDEPPPSMPPEGTRGERPLRASDLFA